MIFPQNAAMLSEILKQSAMLDCKVHILGAGTNVLAPDEGLAGLVICLKDCLVGKRQLDDCLVLSCAHICSIRTASESRGDRFDDDGFTGTGFPCDHIETFVEVHVQVIDDGKILNFDMCNHMDT